ncbi:AAA family ATPase [Pseudomonas aeruginosa]
MKKTIIIGLLVLLACTFAGLSGYAYWSESQSEDTSNTYTVKEPDDVFLIERSSYAQIEKLFVVGGEAFESRTILIKLKGKGVIAFPDIPYEGYRQFEKNYLPTIREASPDIDFRVTSSLLGIGKKLGVDTDPAVLIAKLAAWASLSKVAGFLAMTLIFVAMLIAMFYAQTPMGRSTALRLNPKDIEDDIDDLVGMEDTKKELAQLAEMYKDPERYKSYGADKPFNVLLTGPTGTGKTKTARCLAKILDIPLFYVSGSSLETGIVGGGHRTIKAIYKQALACKRAIIMIDEGNGLLGSREAGLRNKYDSETTNAVLALMDGANTKASRGIIWLIASNFDDNHMKTDDAMMRRLHLKVHYRLPSLNERQEIIRRQLKAKSPERLGGDINVEQLGVISAGMAPAQIEEMINRASLIAIQEHSMITQEILVRAYERLMVGRTDRGGSNISDTKRRVVATHEAGHFIMELHHTMEKVNGDVSRLGDALKVMKISTESVPKLGAEGYVLTMNDESVLLDRDEFERRIMELYGGMANEEVYNRVSGVTAGGYADITQASKMLDTMFHEVGFYADHKINYKVLSNDRSAPGSNRMDEIERCSQRLYERTVRTLKAYRGLTDALVEHLMANYVMTAQEALPIVEEFYRTTSYSRLRNS